MSDAPSHTAFFGDSERTFSLTPDFIVELERLTGTGIGSLAKRLFAGQFHHGDVLATIRLGLIGGGADPQEAHALVAAYAANRPLVETLPLAISILETLWFGQVQSIANPPAKVRKAKKP